MARTHCEECHVRLPQDRRDKFRYPWPTCLRCALVDHTQIEPKRQAT